MYGPTRSFTSRPALLRRTLPAARTLYGMKQEACEDPLCHLSKMLRGDAKMHFRTLPSMIFTLLQDLVDRWGLPVNAATSNSVIVRPVSRPARTQSKCNCLRPQWCSLLRPEAVHEELRLLPGTQEETTTCGQSYE